MNESIVSSCAKLARHTIRMFSRLPNSAVYFFLSCLPSGFMKHLAITYANDKKTDGLGAQLQRLIAIRALAMRLKLNYLHSKVAVLTIHPLDNLKNEAQVDQFLQKVDDYFHLKSSIEGTWAEEEIFLQSLTVFALVKILFRNVIRRKNLLIRVVEPYAVMELRPHDYKRVIPFFYNFPHSETPDDEIVMHYRYGVGNSVIQPGEKLPRQMELTYFRNVIQNIPMEFLRESRALRVLTDAPEFETSFKPRAEQRYLWEGTPNFHNGVVVIKPFSFQEDLGDLELNLKVSFGGDAVESILRMSNCKVLILSRSSLSYVGALFNQRAALIYCAPDFWHPRMKSWI